MSWRLPGLLAATALTACAPSPPADTAPESPGYTADTVLGDSGDSGAGDSGAGDSGAGDSGAGDSGDPGAGGDTAVEVLPDPDYPALCINEFMPDNQSALSLDGDSPDWIELHNPGERAVSLAGWTLSDDAGDPGDPLPEGLSVPAGGFLLLYADGAPERGAEHLSWRLAAEGGELVLLAPDGDGQLIRYGSVSADFSAARATDCCEGDGCWGFDFRGTPGVSNVPPVLEERTLLEAGSEWRYHDADSPPPPTWREPGYDDSAWLSGPAPLGYGDSHQVTVTSYGPDPGDKTITTYFRAEFELDDPGAARELLLSLMLDDGALVWLNGQEALRLNLDEGAIAHDSLALVAVGGAGEYTAYSYAVDPALLTAGTNTLAVEVHQAAPDSSDLTFDLSVEVEIEVE